MDTEKHAVSTVTDPSSPSPLRKTGPSSSSPSVATSPSPHLSEYIALPSLQHPNTLRNTATRTHTHTHQAQRSYGDPFDERPRNENGTTGEYAVATYHHLIFTPIIFVLNGILLFWEFHLNGWVAESLAENPSYGPSVETLIEAGAKRTDLILDDGDWWRLISREMSRFAGLPLPPPMIVVVFFFLLKMDTQLR